MKYLLAVLILLGLTADANACRRCGKFGSSCHYYVKPYVAPAYVAPIVRDNPVYILNNVYPPPLLVGQGATRYESSASYSSLVAPTLDLNKYFSQELELQKATNATSALRTERAQQLFQRALELQSPTTERLAAGYAAKMVLDAAGLSGNAPQGGTQSFVIRRDSYGKVTVEPLASEQPKEGGTPVAPPEAADGKHPLLQQFCGKCHSLATAQPKGGFYLDDDPAVAKAMRDKFFGITQQLRSGAMPPASEPQPTNEQRAAILDEIESIVLSHAKE